LYSTSHKDIAILYLGYGLISSMVATGMSVIIRLELSGPDAQFLHGNNQVFNVLVTGHAIAMIFLFVMPVLIGAFGEKLLNNNINNIVSTNHLYSYVPCGYELYPPLKRDILYKLGLYPLIRNIINLYHPYEFSLERVMMKSNSKGDESSIYNNK